MENRPKNKPILKHFLKIPISPADVGVGEEPPAVHLAQEAGVGVRRQCTCFLIAGHFQTATDDTRNEIQMRNTPAASKATSGMKLPDMRNHATHGASPMRLLGKCRRPVRFRFNVFKPDWDSVMHEHELRVPRRDVHGLALASYRARQMQEQRDCQRTKQHRGVASMHVRGATPVVTAANSISAAKCSIPSSRRADCNLLGITENIAIFASHTGSARSTPILGSPKTGSARSTPILGSPKTGSARSTPILGSPKTGSARSTLILGSPETGSARSTPILGSLSLPRRPLLATMTGGCRTGRVVTTRSGISVNTLVK